jgi:hypothetical protein
VTYIKPLPLTKISLRSDYKSKENTRLTVDSKHSENENKNKYERILTSGSVKEKAMMIGNHLANISYGDKGFLTDDEVSSLVKSITSDKGQAIYKKYQAMFRETDTFLTSIAQCRLTYLEALHRLDKFLVIIQCHKNLEASSNAILDFISEPKAKASAIQQIEYHGTFLHKELKPLYLHYNTSGPDINGHIKVNSINNEEILKIQTQIRNQQTILKTAIQAMKDFLKEQKFSVRAYTKYLRNIESWAKKDKKELIVLRIRKDNDDELAITEPNYEDTKIDLKNYKLYREEYLHG